MIDSPEWERRHSHAELVYDTGTQPFRAGVRSALQRARRLLYTAEERELVLQISPGHQPAHVRLVGQVLDDGEPVEHAAIYLRDASTVIGRITDDDGQFHVPELHAGVYDLDIETVTHLIAVSHLDVAWIA
jgi:hypothetical protein